MIYYNSNTINDWNFGDDNIIKVYRNGAVVFYKFDSEQGGYKVCFAVVEDITQYSDREFEDVYDKATEKWYKLNNLNQYEEYGVYANGRNVTTYNGKLTIDDGYEYEWNGSSWVNLGEVTGSSKTSDFKIGDIKERVTTGVSNGDYLLFSYYRNSDISKPENIMSYNPSNNYLSNLSGYGITSIYSTTIIDPSIWLLESTASANTFYIKSIKNNMYWGYQNTQTSRSLNLVNGSSSEKAPVLITPSCKENCYGFVEKKSNASTGYGGYGLNQLYSYTYQLNWLNNSSSSNPCTFFATDGNADFIIYKMDASDAEYPKYYEEKSEPLDNLTFNTLEEAQAYAEANCVYVGLKATINGDKYVFSGDSQSGYEWVYNPSRLPVGYTEVEYIQNTSHAYLDIGFIPDQDSRIVCDMQQVTENSFPRLWGAGEWNSANGINLNYEGGYLQMSWFGKTSWTQITSVPTNNDRHTYDLNKNYLYVDETLVGSNTYTTKTAAASIGIFCEIRNNGQPPTSGNNPQYWEGEYFKGKMYSFQVYNNGTLVRDLVPCIKDSDNTVGAYDIVNDVFYTVPTGYTTDKLVAGNPV